MPSASDPKGPSHDAAADTFFATVDKAVAFQGPKLARHTFEKVADHAVCLLNDAISAFRARSLGTAVFLAITSIEEVAKAEIAIYRRGPADRDVRPRTDPLFNHRSKHAISVRPTTFMGRLRGILGDDVCLRLQAEAQNGGLIDLREKSLYTTLGEHETLAPGDIVTERRAREMLLLALEVADDVLVGYTAKSFLLGEQIAPWIDEMAAFIPEDETG